MTHPLVERDRRCVWHPYTQAATEPDPLPIQSASGATLTLATGEALIDGISSWWATLHGHGEPRLVEAARQQMKTLDHVLFAGATHEPAVALSEELLRVVPEGLTRCFYSDDGSTAVEVALKMAIQAHIQNGFAERRVFVALEGAYHGDTFGAMAVGDPDPFFLPFAPMLFEVIRVAPTPDAIVGALEGLGARAAGVIMEPQLQGAAGMVVHGPDVVQAARAACDERGIYLVADEVMTGFGRTGRLFSCEGAGVAPDLLCLAKGLTGGTFPLSATLSTEPIFQSFWSEERARALFHGHTFTGNPVGCAIALESLKMVLERDTPALLQAIGERILRRLTESPPDAPIENLRHLGGMVAFDLPTSRSGYLSNLGPALRKVAQRHGVLLRPLGNVVYALPPACTTTDEADAIAEAMSAMANEALVLSAAT
ncbi:MAG: adenosylmethionine--8-amino-7-oxononanoate transaminase [Planctomycetota bacterium]